MFQGGTHKVAEEGMGPVGAALELGVELNGHEPGVVGNLDNFHQVALGVLACHAHAAGLAERPVHDEWLRAVILRHTGPGGGARARHHRCR